MRRALPALLLTLTACGGGRDGKPAESPSAAMTTTAPANPLANAPETVAVREAFEKTLAACPCEVGISVNAFGGRSVDYSTEWIGVYDPKTGSTAAYAEGLKDLQLRVVGGTVHVLQDDKKWHPIDTSKMPAAPKSPFAPMALADPHLVFAVMRSAAGATLTGGGNLYDVEFDLAKAAELAGPSADLLRRMFPEPSVYESVPVHPSGTIRRFGIATSGEHQYRVNIDIKKTGVTAPQVTVEPLGTPIDATTSVT